MIRVIRSDGREMLLNTEMVRSIEAGPPAVLTLVNGEKIELKSPASDVMEKMFAYRVGFEEEQKEPEPEEEESEPKKSFKKKP